MNRQRAFRQRKELQERELKDQVTELRLRLEEAQAEKEDLKDRIPTSCLCAGLQRCDTGQSFDERNLQTIQRQLQSIVDDLGDTATDHKRASLERNLLLRVLTSIKSLVNTALDQPEDVGWEIASSNPSKSSEHPKPKRLHPPSLQTASLEPHRR